MYECITATEFDTALSCWWAVTHDDLKVIVDDRSYQDDYKSIFKGRLMLARIKNYVAYDGEELTYWRNEKWKTLN